MTTLGAAIPSLLRAYGISTVFGIPGVHTAEIYRGLPGSGLHHITPRHEQGAGFMADGFARASGHPAACFVVSGPGTTNIATAMGQAFSDSIPMLVVSSVTQTLDSRSGNGRLHQMKNQSALMAGVSAFSRTVRSLDGLSDALDDAFEVFSSERPRPVHIEMPVDVLTAPQPGSPRPPRTPQPGPKADPVLIKEAARLLKAAKRPYVVLGGGAVDAGPAVQALVAALGAPTILSINAKGILPPEHPLNLGSTLPCASVRSALEAADAVLAIGTEFSETDTLLFEGALALGGSLIRVDIDEAQLDRSGHGISIHADALDFATALLAKMSNSTHRSWRISEVRELRAQAHQEMETAYRSHGAMFRAIARAIPDALFVGDSTQPIYGANMTYDAGAPRRYFNSTTGFGTLGYALPAAIGAKLAASGSSVICVIGDGGLQFTIGELSTAAELQLPLPVLVWNNHGYGEIKRYMQERGIPPIAVDVRPPDICAVARGFGCDAARATSPQHLAGLVADACRRPRPCVIEVMEEDALSWPWQPS